MISEVPAKSPIALLRTALGALLALLAAACAAPEAVKPVEPQVLVYPLPPDPARFYFDRILRSSFDVKRLTPEFSLRIALTGEVGERALGLVKPFGVAAHRGRVFVSDSVTRQVIAFDYPEGKVIQIGLGGPGVLSKPLGINVDRDGNLYVADITARRIVVYDRDGNYLRAMGGTALLRRPGSVAVDSERSRLYVVDTGGVDSQDHRLAVFDPRSGEHLGFIGTRGVEPGNFNLPREVAVGPDGRLYVTDGGNFRVQVFEPDGTFVRAFGRAGRQMGQFARPKGIAVDRDSNVFVVDAAFGNVQIFSAEGQLLMVLGSRGASGGPAEYFLPAGIALDEDGRVYVVDQWFRKVDIYRPATVGAGAGWLSRSAPPAAGVKGR